MTERTYRLISGDSHVNEPGDLWTATCPAARSAIGRRASTASSEGDAWVIEGVRDPINFGMNVCAGLEPSEMHAWSRFEDMRPAATTPRPGSRRWTTTASTPRCSTPRPRLAQGVVATKDADFHLALVRAYNDWLSEYVALAPERFAGLMLLPNRGADRPRSRRSTACSAAPGSAA